MIYRSDREKYILSLAGKVKAIALRLCKRMCSPLQTLQRDDFIQAGWVGAIKAVDSYDPVRGTLEAYAEYRIRGEILDYMRQCDFLSRDYRHEVKDSETAPKNISMHHIKDARQIVFEDVRAVKSYERINARETVLSILRRAELSERSRQVILQYYWDVGTQKEIGKMHGVKESRISQIRSKALEKCKAATV